MSISEDRQEETAVIAGKDRGSVPAFFESIGTNLIRLMCCNVVFVICNIPAMAVAFLILGYILPQMSTSFLPSEFTATMMELGLHGQTNRSGEITGEEAAVNLYLLFMLFCIMLLVSSLLVCVGPVQAGLSRVYGLFMGGGSESSVKAFKLGVKENLKQSFGAMFISIAVTFICLLAVSFYMNLGIFAGLPLAVLFAAILVFFSLVQNIVYRMMVTRELGLFKMYKNAFILVLLKFGRSLGMVVLNCIVFGVIPFVLLMNTQIVSVGIYVFLYFFVLTAVMHYINTVYADSLITRYMKAGEEEKDD